jgi:hypothetical protein
MTYLNKACRFTVAAILLLVASDHLMNFDRFAVTLNNYDVVAPDFLFEAAALIIISMLSAGFTMLMSSTKIVGSWLGVAVFAMFSIALLSAMLRGIEVSCGCVVGERPIDFVAFLKPLSLAIACFFLTREMTNES